MRSPNNFTLVAGVDSSGKSTFLRQLEAELGYTVLEPTSTPEAKEFKSLTLETPITNRLIAEREALYLDLNRSFDQTVATRLQAGDLIATTGSRLVTLLSHAVMRSIASFSDQKLDTCIQGWLNDSKTAKPEIICLVYAPEDVLRKRIIARQQAGDQTEKFWGFNAPFFLGHYQQAWHATLDHIQDKSDITCLELDSSTTTPHTMRRLFEIARDGYEQS